MAVITKIIFTMYAIHIVQTNTLSTEDDMTYTNVYNHYVPSSAKIQKFFTVKSTNNPISEEQTDISITKASFQVEELHPDAFKNSTTSPDIDKKELLNLLNIQKTTVASTDPANLMEEPEEPIRVIPIRHYQRGVLDILFPADRVKSFKTVFDSFRRILSHTLKK